VLVSSLNPVTDVHGPEDNLIDRFFIYYLPLNGLRAFENLLNNCSITGVGQGG